MRLHIVICLLLGLLSCNSQKDTAEAPDLKTSQDTIPQRPASIVSIYLLQEIMMPDGGMQKVEELDITMELQSQNQIMGFSGCNQFHGEYSYAEGVFQASKLASTKKMCMENMDVEDAFLKYLQVPLEAESVDRGLELSSQDAVVLKLKKIDE